MFALTLSAFLAFPLAPATSAERPEADLATAMLSEDWDAVANGKQTVASSSARSPVLSLLIAHASLATNKNNTSVALLAAASSPDGLALWDHWTEVLLNGPAGHPRLGHQQSPVAWYLRGDALARLKQWREAKACFDEALRLKPDWHLALNARGVVQHALGDPMGAEKDFQAAIRSSEDFADAHASLGTCGVRTRSVEEAERIRENFETAGKLCRDKQAHGGECLLALNGIGCASYMKARYQEARETFRRVPASSPVAPLARANTVAVAIADVAAAAESRNRPGMTIEARVFDGGQVFRSRIPWEEKVPNSQRISASERENVENLFVLPDASAVLQYRDGTVKVMLRESRSPMTSGSAHDRLAGADRSKAPKPAGGGGGGSAAGAFGGAGAGSSAGAGQPSAGVAPAGSLPTSGMAADNGQAAAGGTEAEFRGLSPDMAGERNGSLAPATDRIRSGSPGAAGEEPGAIAGPSTVSGPAPEAGLRGREEGDRESMTAAGGEAASGSGGDGPPPPPGAAPAAATLPLEAVERVSKRVPIRDRIGLLTGSPVLFVKAEPDSEPPTPSLDVSLRTIGPSLRESTSIPQSVAEELDAMLGRLKRSIHEQVPVVGLGSASRRGKVGGVEASTSEIRNRTHSGPWSATNVYGLLYDVPAQASPW